MTAILPIASDNGPRGRPRKSSDTGAARESATGDPLSSAVFDQWLRAAQAPHGDPHELTIAPVRLAVGLLVCD
ncbi:hypothetical protein GCM10010424_38090 [Streptomyces lienomycini]